MAPPKHLWSGDWESESAAARPSPGPFAVAARPAPPSEPPPEPPPPPPRGPSFAEQFAAWVQRAGDRLRSLAAATRPYRALLLAALATLLIVGGAIALSGSGSGAPGSQQPGYLGLQLDDWPTGGALIVSIIPGAPAQTSGLQPGDVIQQINNQPIQTAADVTSALATMHSGDSVIVQVNRGPFPYSIHATLGPRPNDGETNP